MSKRDDRIFGAMEVIACTATIALIVAMVYTVVGFYAWGGC